MPDGGDPRLLEQFPFPTSVSLERLIGRIEAAAADPDSPWKALADRIMEDLEGAPELRGKPSHEALERHRDVVATMMTLVFPPVGHAELLGAAMEPYRMIPIYETEAARRQGVFTLDNLVNNASLPTDLMKSGMAMSAYQYVLQRFYGSSARCEPSLVITVPGESGLSRHLQLSWSPEFLEVELHGELPELSADDLEAIQGDPLNIELVSRLLPPERFELTGFGIATATDVTAREVVSRLKDDLIQKGALASPRRVELIQDRIRNLVESPDAVVGFIAFDESPDIERIDWARPVGRSLLFKGGEPPTCGMKSHSTYAEALAKGQPIVLQDLSEDTIQSGYEGHLLSLGYRSFVLCPLVMDDRIIGLMELASPHPGDLNAFSAMMLIDVAPLFTAAIHRTVEEQADRIEAVIKKNYTSIHPAVEWRFRRAALEIMKSSDPGDVQVPEIILDNVYPLYGLSDIRGSSTRRNLAIRADLVRQLELARAAVQAASVARPMLILDELAHRIDGYVERIGEVLGSEDEQSALDFLTREVEPMMDHLAGMSDGASARVQAYREAIDPKLGVIYDRRKAFDESVSHINALVSRVIDEHEDLAQLTVPHLFERFKTDGVDYNIYLGESISGTRGFHPLFLKELRLWQLALHCRIEWRARELTSALDEPLELTHLILVQDLPLSIRFRADEKRFDVDGAYNIRYEIIKKRIDKATIRGTGDRLTQPGTLAVVYSQPHEAAEYRRYLAYLASAGFVDGIPTELDLEDLQGVHGLKALRVDIHREPPQGATTELELPASVRQRLVSGVAGPSQR